MTTTRTLLRHFTKPLLQRNPDLRMKGIMLYLTPIQHVSRVVLIDRTGGSQRDITWSAGDLFSRQGSTLGKWGGPVFGGRGAWELTDPDGPTQLVEVLETEALPKLRAIKSLEDFYQFATYREDWDFFWHGKISGFPTYHAPVLAALGRFEEAREVCRAMPQDPWFKELGMRPEFDRVLDELYPLLIAEDRPALAQLLRSWEESTIRANKLEDIWEPTPFPFEEA